MRALWPWLRLVAAAGILVALGWQLGAGAVLDGLRSIGFGSVLAALGIGALTTLASAQRWRLVAGGLALPLTLGRAVADYYRGLLLNAVLPAGVLGDVHRAVSHGKESGDLGRGVRAVVFERFAGQVVLIATGAGVLATGAVPAFALELSPPLIGSVFGGAAVVLVLQRIPAVRRELAATLADARALLAGGLLLRVGLLSAAGVAGHVLLFLVAARVAGVTAPLGQLLPLFVLALLVMAVPVNLGGFGPREAFLAVAFGAAGLGAERGLATGVVYGALALVSALPGVLTLLPGQRREGVPERLDQSRQQLRPLAG
ncbi:lysylphosphatidylglycerol synthase transmembrane domain-containing protein [Crossiella sp. CA-258035]|uniref:lysylphosphatidylglycerol synthase transmembrane domain-containing protein n=1 Tax=Crossiella sp. CA-258035 TaxID=2981138 RepID=UPI0024BCA268|nr:lysylphosphatidylglycerol synthase transmembrane domain-containing protein [Crossiella sp. CA-258035]WHT16518.1 lysylphosphatidylglycerol synthase transmembrane domain-containing protein [Crossiella sp. CA-258035]